MKILLVGDHVDDLYVLGGLLKNASDYSICYAESGREALDNIYKINPDMILMEVMMSDINGFDVCKELKHNDSFASIPVIFITSNNNPESVVEGFEAGGVDYVTKPFNITELLMRIGVHMDLKLSRDLLEQKNKELSEAYEKIERLALTDTLTGIGNRRSISNMMGKEASRSRRNGTSFSIIMSDIDHFKRVNDKYGHDVGDKVLRVVANVIQDNLRQQDIVARWGGEEFLVMLPETKIDNACSVAEKLRSAVEKEPMDFVDDGFRLTMTFGVATYEHDLGLEKSIKKADDALYEGKQTGRNKVVQAHTRLRNTL